MAFKQNGTIDRSKLRLFLVDDEMSGRVGGSWVGVTVIP